MAERQKGMGRGLAAILSVAPKDEPEELRQLPVDLVAPNPNQPRRTFDEESLLALAESIRARGVLQPVLVRPLPGGRFELIAGERRWRAARIAELETIPAIVRRHDDAESLELALIENMAREDLNPVDEARACAALVEELSLTREEVGLRVGRSRVAVSNLIRLLDLPDEALALIERGDLTEGHGRALLLAEDHGDRRARARGGRPPLVGPRTRGTRPHAPPPATRPRREPEAGRSTPTRRRRSTRSPTPSAEALGTDVGSGRAGCGTEPSSQFGSLEEALDIARRLRLRPAA